MLVLSTQNQIKRRKPELHQQKVSEERENGAEFNKIRSRKKSVTVAREVPWNFSALSFISPVKCSLFSSYLYNPVSIMANGALVHFYYTHF